MSTGRKFLVKGTFGVNTRGFMMHEAGVPIADIPPQHADKILLDMGLAFEGELQGEWLAERMRLLISFVGRKFNDIELDMDLITSADRVHKVMQYCVKHNRTMIWG